VRHRLVQSIINAYESFNNDGPARPAGDGKPKG